MKSKLLLTPKRIVLVALLFLLTCSQALAETGQQDRSGKFVVPTDSQVGVPSPKKLYDSGYATFIVTDNGDLVGWGNNDWQLLSSNKFPYAAPHVILSKVAAVYPRGRCALALRENGELFGWGTDIAGELIFPLEERPYKVKLMDHVVSAGIGAFHCAAVKSDGTLWTWGRNREGELGIGQADEKINEPQEVMQNMASVYLHDDITFAIDREKNVYVWGEYILSPIRLSAEIVDVAYMYGTKYQLLTEAGQIKTFDYQSDMDQNGRLKRADFPIADTDVKSVCDLGYIKTDGSFWRWYETREGVSLEKIADHIVDAQGVVYSNTIMRTSANEIVATGEHGKVLWKHSMLWVDVIKNVIAYVILAPIAIVSILIYRRKSKHKAAKTE